MPSKKNKCKCGNLKTAIAKICIKCSRKPENNYFYVDGNGHWDTCSICNGKKRKKSKFCEKCSYKNRKNTRDKSGYFCNCGSKKTYYAKNCTKCANEKKKKPVDTELTSIRNAWVNMKQRCYNKNHKSYKHYGGRGIKVCKRWLNSFENFFQDMGRKGDPKLTLERINNNKGYSPENCKWDTRSNQNRNKRYNLNK